MKSRNLLMIPGPIEFEHEVLQSMSSATPSHVDPKFISTFHHSLKLMKEVWQAPSGQAFIVAGSGTFAMEMAAANLIEQGDKVLVISTGYFGLRYAEILKRYTADVDILEAEVGDVVAIEDIEQQLKTKPYKLLCFTHVDTSTAVLNDAKAIGELAQKYNVLTLMDAVCSVAGEEIKQEEWGLDIVVSASQKAIGVPPGLALLVASLKSIHSFKQRKTKVQNYYADWTNWLPIMKAYENKEASYFATPPVNLIIALEKSLEIITAEGLEQCFERHRKAGKAMRAALRALGLELVSKNEKLSANTLSAPFYPDNIDGTNFLKSINEQGVTLAGGLLHNLKGKYFRIGHMGSVNQNDLLATIGAIEKALQKHNHQHNLGAGTKKTLELF
ncbi:alanine--glyoxylate aminotransferase family protein [Weeksellaceae bacterium KMM 9713]|uniref:Alanine--glyoxylate aminotransferase family protein n=1 Tax=Profundicola chukchiensis TaxID=2961959 RepID=A0A9X4RXE3_9FLAO|nr:alanine--glyoxylate aminotransferase family protein [Profundicola chukchiensis]MDG4946229.1 alanine--glyoxylate aminotransferase family protein [Profundicola chukchiensis]